MFGNIILCLSIGVHINGYADVATRADEFFNKEDIANQSTDYPNLGILSDVGVGLRLVQTRSHALKKLNWAVNSELSAHIKQQKKLEKTLEATNKLLTDKADEWPKERLEVYRKNKIVLEKKIFIQSQEIILKQDKMRSTIMSFKNSRYQNIAKRQFYIRKFAAFGIVLTLVDLAGQFITDVHSPGENDHILGSGLWEFFEVFVENTNHGINEIFHEEKVQEQLDQKLLELEAR